MINWIKQKFNKTKQPLTAPIEHENKVSVIEKSATPAPTKIKKAAKLSEPKKPRGRPKKKTN